MVSLVYGTVQIGLYFAVTYSEGVNIGSGVLIVIIIFGAIVAITALTVLGFCMFHVVLQTKGRTTKEFIKNKMPQATKEKNDLFGATPSYLDYNHVFSDENSVEARKHLN